MRTIYVRKLRYEEARSRFLTELDKAFMAGERHVEVIHGIGTYTLKKMVEKEVAALDYAEILESQNPGSTLLELLAPEPHILKQYQ